MTAQTLSAYHTRVLEILGPLADAHARETGFLKRRSKLTGPHFVLVLVAAFWSATPRSLAAYARLAERLHPGLTLTPQSLHGRFTPCAVALLKRVLAAALALTVRAEPRAGTCLAAFPALYLLDSTTIALPEALAPDYRGSGGAASAAAAKCFWLLEWHSATTRHLLLADGVKADQDMGTRMLAQTEPAALWLFDLGFWNLAFLDAIARHGSFFVSRLHGNVTVRTPAGERVDVLGWVRGCAGAVHERPITLGATQRLACRVIAERVPEAVAAKRRRVCKEGARRRGRGLRAETLARLDWTLWVTNVEERVVPARHVRTIYRIRWQVELLFKLAKSTVGIAAISSTRTARVECELYAGLIALVIAGHVGALARPPGTEISAVKLWQALRETVVPWCQALLGRRGPGSLRVMIDWIARHATPTKRRRTPSTFSMIANLGLAPPLAAAHAP